MVKNDGYRPIVELNLALGDLIVHEIDDKLCIFLRWSSEGFDQKFAADVLHLNMMVVLRWRVSHFRIISSIAL